MKFAVIGATGYSGSHTCIELLNRGHEVVGISRSPEKLGKHKMYTPLKLDVTAAPIEDIFNAFKGIDVVVNGFNPPPGPALYKTFVETTRKLIIAAKAHNNIYFIMIGGTGSLELPNEKYKTAADSRDFWLAYRRSVADSETSTKHMEDRIGPGAMSDGMRAYRNARLALKAGKAGDEEDEVIKETEDVVKYSDNWIPELPIAARATFLMFEGNQTFDWTFVSPSPRFRPGPRTGKYEVWVDEVPLSKEAKGKSEDGNEFEGRLLGVSAADLAVAVVDEAEKREKTGKHWSPTSEWEGDGHMPTTITIS